MSAREELLLKALRECRQELALAQQGCADPDCRVCKSNRETLERYDAIISAHSPAPTAHGGADVYGNADGTI